MDAANVVLLFLCLQWFRWMCFGVECGLCVGKKYEAFCLWNFVDVGKLRWVALPDGYKSTRGDWDIAVEFVNDRKPDCE